MSINVYQMVTDRIIAQLEKGIIPWHKPWHILGGTDSQECAISYTSRKPYSLLNQMLLGKPGEYLTFKQIQEAGGTIKKGEKSKFVVFYQMLRKEDKEHLDANGNPKIISIPLLKYYNVWHIDQTEGVQTKYKEGEKEIVGDPTLTPNERAEAIINGYLAQKSHPKLRVERSNQAFYRPSTDEVVVPLMEQYAVQAEYYSTTFHELVHSTGHESRCARKGITDLGFFGSHEYSKEELVAESGAAMLLFEAGIDCASAFRNNVAYIQSWLKELKNDNKMIVWATSQAEHAVKWIMGLENEETKRLAAEITKTENKED